MNPEPYDAPWIASILRTMAPERLASVTPVAFQTWPTRRIVATRVINDLIDAERAQRGRAG